MLTERERDLPEAGRLCLLQFSVSEGSCKNLLLKIWFGHHVTGTRESAEPPASKE